MRLLITCWLNCRHSGEGHRPEERNNAASLGTDSPSEAGNISYLIATYCIGTAMSLAFLILAVPEALELR